VPEWLFDGDVYQRQHGSIESSGGIVRERTGFTRFRPSLPHARGRRLSAAIALTAALAAPAFALAPIDAVQPAPPPAAAPPTAPGNPELTARLDSPGILTIAGERLNGDLLRRFYAAHGNQTMWDTRPAQATALWDAVLHAGSHGLDPNMFHAGVLARQPSLPTIERDLLLSDGILRYADALAEGAVTPNQRPENEDLSPGPVDIVAALDAVLEAPDPARALEGLAPSTPEYVALRRAYAIYMAIAQAGGWPRVGEVGRAEHGVADSRLQQLQRRLEAEGYLPAGYTSASYDGPTQQAVKTFQEHHGLDPNGRLTAATIAELNVPAEMRAGQVVVNLERLRWLPRTLPADRVWVNAANERLELFQNNKVTFSTRVVVGEVDKQTPEFQSNIVSVLYNPPWNIPYSIAQKEILPKLEADPGYLERHHMVMRGNGSVQQVAGPWSALGQLKFEMPDKFDVYLHDTPLKQLFARENRRMSHGCVRVQNPRVLASLLLNQSVEAIGKGIAAGGTTRHMLPAPVPVFIVYQTVFADADGSLQFRHDVYERDDDIWQHLIRSPQAPVAQESRGAQRGG